MTPGRLGAVAAMDAPQFEGLRKVDGLRKVAAMDAPQFEGFAKMCRRNPVSLTIEAGCAGETGFRLQLRLGV